MTTRRSTSSAPATQPSARAARQTRPRARVARRGASSGGGRREQQQTTDDEPQPAHVNPIGPQEDRVQAVRHDAEADSDQAKRQTERHPRRANQPRLREHPGQRDGHNHNHAEQRGVRPRERQIEQMHRDQHEPCHQQRPLQASKAVPPRSRRLLRGGHWLGTLAGGGHLARTFPACGAAGISNPSRRRENRRESIRSRLDQGVARAYTCGRTPTR